MFKGKAQLVQKVTFETGGFQMKPLWKLKILQKLLLLSFLHLSYKNTENIPFRDSVF